MTEQSKMESRAKIRFVVWCLLAFFFILGDIFAFRAPLFAFIICPLIVIILAGVGVVRKNGLKRVLSGLVLGPQVLLLLVTIFTPLLGEMHDKWLIGEVRRWGSDLRQQRSETGAFPDSQKRFLHGYRAVFINNEPTAPSVILVDLFGQDRVAYSVAKDELSERREI